MSILDIPVKIDEWKEHNFAGTRWTVPIFQNFKGCYKKHSILFFKISQIKSVFYALKLKRPSGCFTQFLKICIWSIVIFSHYIIGNIRKYSRMKLIQEFI